MNLTLALGVIALWITCLVGWVLNIIDIIGTLGGDITALLVCRLVGVFAFPLGAVLGLVT